MNQSRCFAIDAAAHCVGMKAAKKIRDSGKALKIGVWASAKSAARLEGDAAWTAALAAGYSAPDAKAKALNAARLAAWNAVNAAIWE